MANNLYVLYDLTTGVIYDVIQRSASNWAGDYPLPAGQALKKFPGIEWPSSLTHYVIITPVGDDIPTEKPALGLGVDATLEGDGTPQVIANTLPVGTKVYLDFEYLGEFDGDYEYTPTSPGDNGVHRFDFEPPFPNAPEVIWITVIDP